MTFIYEDTRQQAGKHERKHEWWRAHGVDVQRRKLDTGDYMADGCAVTVDTKASVQELAGDLTRDHDRFAREADRARDGGIRLVILVEDGRFSSVGELGRWIPHTCAVCGIRRARACNPRGAGRCKQYARHPLRGRQLAGIARTFCEHHGCEIEFCAPRDSARRVCELLGVELWEVEGDADVHEGAVREDGAGGAGAR